MTIETDILAGRNAVLAYGEAHRNLSLESLKDLPAMHTPLLNALLGELEKIGFNSVQGFLDADREYDLNNLLGSSKVWTGREDLLLLSPINEEGIEIVSQEYLGESSPVLLVDGIGKMSTRRLNHASMLQLAQGCPDNARVLVGGLGLGLILLYLAASGAKEVVVCEIEERLVRIFGSQCLTWFTANYPDFKLSIVMGDISKKVKRLGKFDWIFLDTGDSLDESLFTPYLTRTGKIATWREYVTEWG